MTGNFIAVYTANKNGFWGYKFLWDFSQTNNEYYTRMLVKPDVYGIVDFFSLHHYTDTIGL